MQTQELCCLGQSKAPVLGCLRALFGPQRLSPTGHQLRVFLPQPLKILSQKNTPKLSNQTHGL